MRIICIGAHPDDCEIGFGGAAEKFAAGGHAVKFLSVTNGDAGHHRPSGGGIAAIREIRSPGSCPPLGIAEAEILGIQRRRTDAVA